MQKVPVLLLVLTAFGCDQDTPGDGGDTKAEAGDTADDSASCELWEGDATYPGDCQCASPGEECVQGCLIPDGVQTCAQVCEALGEACVQNQCDGGTYVGGTTCPAPGEFGPSVPHPCDAPVPVDDDPNFGVSCCCTR